MIRTEITMIRNIKQEFVASMIQKFEDTGCVDNVVYDNKTTIHRVGHKGQMVMEVFEYVGSDIAKVVHY
tara:strand:+ start:1353 stop:1559 length:207 start_codon:yes stop_codon:yes gene_type:complete